MTLIYRCIFACLIAGALSVLLPAPGAAQLNPGASQQADLYCQNSSGAFVPVSPSAPCPVTTAPTTLTPSSTAAVGSNLVLKASAGTLYGGSVTATVAGYLLVFNATSLPANGAVTPVKCISVPANQTVGFSADAGTAWTFSTGITLGYSTTGCYTLTASATAFLTGQFQ